MNAPTVLVKILNRKKEEIAERSAKASIDILKKRIANQEPARGFIRSMREKLSNGESAVIAEIKKASPSKGVIRENFDLEDIAISYEAAGAACLSVLTDKDFFQGEEDYLVRARLVTQLPVIRKDFIIDEYQVYEARSIGADCILLIVAAFIDNKRQLWLLNDLAYRLGMDVLVEVHNKEELDIALAMNLQMVGINNRNLHTFDVSLENTFNLLEFIPKDVMVVTESGIHSNKDVEAMRAHNVNAFLVGEAFMRAEDPGAELKKLFF
jgi:indole-3-glycerol phosphate synthase